MVEKKREPSVESVDNALNNKPIEENLWQHVEETPSLNNTIDGNESDVSDREPSSTVTIKTPDFNEELEREKEIEILSNEVVQQPTTTTTVAATTTAATPQTVWKGFVQMVDVAKFFITAQEISGQAQDLMDELPDTVDVVGRVSHEVAWEYISKMKRIGSKELIVLKLTAANDEEKIPYITLYSYLNSRNRLGVVNNFSKKIKDFYIMPFSSQSEIPPVLQSIIGGAIDKTWLTLLLGIIVRNKYPRPLQDSTQGPVPAKVAKKDDRSYTPPPLLLPTKEKLPVPPPAIKHPEKSTFARSGITIDSETISKIVPELSSRIDFSSSSPDKLQLDDEEDEEDKSVTALNDDDEPYSPGAMDEEMNNERSASFEAEGDLDKNTDLQKKMEEINRQIEEQKQLVQNMQQNSLMGESPATLPVSFFFFYYEY